MDIRTQSALLAFIVGTTLGLAMLLRSGRSRVQFLYAAFACSVAGYYLSQFAFYLVTRDANPWLWRVTLGAMLTLGSTVPSAALSFFLEFLKVSPSAVRNGR